MALSARRNGSGRRDTSYYWPGFVDATATLLLVFVFLLSIFAVAQFLLAREISGQDTVLERLRSQLAELTEILALEQSERVELETTLSAVTSQLELARSENIRLHQMLDAGEDARDAAGATIAGLRSDLEAEREISASALARVELLNQQLSALRRQIAALNEALEASETRDQEARTQIADLGRRLNAALAQRVQMLARYRSEFFGRLREILSQRADIEIVGDRFVFQAEVLFPRGQATFNPEAREELDKLAAALKELDEQIPAEIPWVLRVDGHTDIDPIRTAQFPSNWELSTARAIAVVKYLIEHDVDPLRLVAAGFGEFHPIDDRDTDEAKARNRRIELKLTER